jgi:hypothetical protein
MSEVVMGTDVTPTGKGQAPILKEIRDRLQIKEGDRTTFTLLPCLVGSNAALADVWSAHGIRR